VNVQKKLSLEFGGLNLKVSFFKLLFLTPEPRTRSQQPARRQPREPATDKQIKMRVRRHRAVIAFVLLIQYFVQVTAFHEDYAIPIVREISPSHGSILGGTAVRVLGDNFNQNTVKSCLFWGNEASVVGKISTDLIEIVPVYSYISITEVVCISAASKKPHDVHLLLVAHEELASLEGTLNERGQKFTYHEEVKIVSVRPEWAETSGNVTVNINGGPFYRSDGLHCMFGVKKTSAAFISSTQITCQTPPHPVGMYSLEVSQNGQDFTRSSFAFRFYHSSKVESIHPTHGPARQAGTRVTVIGENFLNSTSLRCRFESVVVPATFISSSEVHCHTPPIKNADQSWLLLPDQRHRYSLDQLFPSSHAYPRYSGRLVSFELTNNGQDFTDSGLMFLYQNDVQVEAISRSIGPSSGGTPVIISGSNFVNSTDLSCRFGNSKTKAHFLTRQSILCFSTPIHGRSYRNSQKEKVFPILVSNNAIDYSYAGDFIYTSSIPHGMYQAGVEGSHTMLSCPRGSFCTEVLDTNFTLCSPGTYQPLPSQSQCVSCPIGYLCSHIGMSAPILCPAGYGECLFHLLFLV
jgi:hypothetical protein